MISQTLSDKASVSNLGLFLPERLCPRPVQLGVSYLEKHSVTLSARLRHQLFGFFSLTAFHQDATRRSWFPDVAEAGTLVPVFGQRRPPTLATATVKIQCARIQGFR